MSVEENKAVMHRWFEEVWSKGNLDLIDELVDPNSISRLPDGAEVHGADNWKRWVAANRATYPNLQVTVEDMLAEGDKVATRWTARGIYQGESKFLAPGKEIAFTSIGITRLASGKRVESWEEMNVWSLMQQFGWLPVWPEGRTDFGWGEPSKAKSAPGDREKNKTIVRRFFEEARGNWDPEQWDGMAHPDYVPHCPDFAHLHSREEFKQSIIRSRDTSLNCRITVEDMVADGDRVAARWVQRGTLSTGKLFLFPVISICRIADGRVIEDWWACDAFNGSRKSLTLPLPMA